MEQVSPRLSRRHTSVIEESVTRPLSSCLLAEKTLNIWFFARLLGSEEREVLHTRSDAFRPTMSSWIDIDM